MDIQTVKRKRRGLTIILTATGFLIAAVIWAYSKLADSSPPHFNLPLWATFMVLCPPSLLSAALIDVEPASSGFTLVWLVIGLVNAGLYAVAGTIVGRFRWKPDRQPVAGSGAA